MTTDKKPNQQKPNQKPETDMPEREPQRNPGNVDIESDDEKLDPSRKRDDQKIDPVDPKNNDIGRRH